MRAVVPDVGAGVWRSERSGKRSIAAVTIVARNEVLEDLGTQPKVTYLAEGNTEGMSDICEAERKINADLLRPLQQTSVWFYLLVAVLGTIVLCGAGAWIYQMWNGIGGRRHPVADLLGLLHHEFRVLDRHQPRGHADLGDSSSRQCHLAAARDPVRRSDHGFRA